MRLPDVVQRAEHKSITMGADQNLQFLGYEVVWVGDDGVEVRPATAHCVPKFQDAFSQKTCRGDFDVTKIQKNWFSPIRLVTRTLNEFGEDLPAGKSSRQNF